MLQYLYPAKSDDIFYYKDVICNFATIFDCSIDTITDLSMYYSVLSNVLDRQFWLLLMNPSFVSQRFLKRLSASDRKNKYRFTINNNSSI